MSKIQVLVDLGELELENSDLTPADVIRAVRDFDAYRRENERLHGLLRAARIHGMQLKEIVDSDTNLMDKFRNLRQLAQVMIEQMV